MVRIGWSAELLIGTVRAVGWLWVAVVDGWLGCAVVVGGSEVVGGTLCWRQLVLLVEAWWGCSSDGVLGAKIDGEDGG